MELTPEDKKMLRDTADLYDDWDRHTHGKVTEYRSDAHQLAQVLRRAVGDVADKIKSRIEGRGGFYLPSQIVRFIDEIHAEEQQLQKLTGANPGRDLSRESERLSIVTQALIRERERVRVRVRRARRTATARGTEKATHGSDKPAGG